MATLNESGIEHELYVACLEKNIIYSRSIKIQNNNMKCLFHKMHSIDTFTYEL